MNTVTNQEDRVRKSLFKFIKSRIPSADLSVIDEVVLSYVVSMMDNFSSDPIFDIDGFYEMMMAYIPEFGDLDPGVVYAWIMDLESILSNKETDIGDKPLSEDRITQALQSLTQNLPTVTKSSKNNSNKHAFTRSSTSSESSETPSSESDNPRGHVEVVDQEELSEQCQALHEMFPNSSLMEIKHCVSIANGDVEGAAATLLHRREAGHALTPAGMTVATTRSTIDDTELKNRIIARYSYIDKNAETKEHKPLAPKMEPKKMVRYRDNKIVSLKGERYTEVPRAGAEDEHPKKNKKPHCP